MKRWALFFMAAAMTLAATVSAKQTPPMDAQLVLGSSRTVGDSVEYRLDFSFRPWDDSEKVVFRLELPENFKLVHGFSLWEGELSKTRIFLRTFELHGPAGAAGEIKLSIQLSAEGGASFAHILLMNLSQDTPLQKSISADEVGRRAHKKGEGILRR